MNKNVKQNITTNQLKQLGVEKYRQIEDIIQHDYICLLPEQITIGEMLNVLINSEYGFPQISIVKNGESETITIRSMNGNFQEFSGSELCDVLWDAIVSTKIYEVVNN